MAKRLRIYVVCSGEYGGAKSPIGVAYRSIRTARWHARDEALRWHETQGDDPVKVDANTWQVGCDLFTVVPVMVED